MISYNKATSLSLSLSNISIALLSTDLFQHMYIVTGLQSYPRFRQNCAWFAILVVRYVEVLKSNFSPNFKESMHCPWPENSYRTERFSYLYLFFKLLKNIFELFSWTLTHFKPSFKAWFLRYSNFTIF